MRTTTGKATAGLLMTLSVACTDGGTPGSTDECGVPAGATVLAGYAAYGEDSVVREIVVESSEVVFRADAGIYAAPRGGGTAAQARYTCPGDLGSLSCELWDLDGAGFVVLTREGVVDASFAPVSYPAWIDPMGGPNPPGRALVTPAGVRIGKYDEYDLDLVPRSSGLTLLEPGAAQADVLFSGAGGGGGRAMVFGDGAVFTNVSSLGGGELPMPDAIWRLGVEAGDVVAPVTVDKAGPVVVVTANFIYFNSDPRGPLDEQGLWRAPIGGGTAERLGGVLGGFGGATDGTLVVFTDATNLYAIEDQAGATLRSYALPVRSTLDASCTNHGLAVRDGEIYSSMFDEAAGESLLFKLSAN